MNRRGFLGTLTAIVAGLWFPVRWATSWWRVRRDRTLYVAEDGQDVQGHGRSPGTPFRTLAHALAEATDRETIILLPGPITVQSVAFQRHRSFHVTGLGA